MTMKTHHPKSRESPCEAGELAPLLAPVLGKPCPILSFTGKFEGLKNESQPLHTLQKQPAIAKKNAVFPKGYGDFGVVGATGFEPATSSSQS